MGMIKSRYGFTLVELLIVITLVGILSTIALMRYGNLAENARKVEALTVLSEIVSAEKRYALDSTTSSYTNTLTALDSFSTAPYSQNFTFYATTATSGYVQAIRTGTDSGRMSYGMCIESKKSATCNSSGGCNPNCP